MEKVSAKIAEQPIFYPVMNIKYACQITVEGNVQEYGSGFLTKFEVNSAYLKKFKVENVGGTNHN